MDLIRAHLSQVLKNGLVDLDAIEALARVRGFEGRIRHAEAFEIGRFVWDVIDPSAEPLALVGSVAREAH